MFLFPSFCDSLYVGWFDKLNAIYLVYGAVLTMLKVILIVIIIAAVLLAAALYMVKPNVKRDTSYFHAKSYAHRGLHGAGVPENSIQAFALAVEKGYGVELDVQMTKDGKVVVFHDGTLKRMCGVDGFLKDFTYDELQQFRLAGTDQRIPLFSDVLEVLKETDLICEIKGDNGNHCYELCEKTYKQLCGYKGKFMVESFVPFLLKWFRDNHPEIIRGQLSCNMKEESSLKGFSQIMMTHLLVNCISRPDFIAYKHQDTGMLGYRLCKRAFRPFLVAWTARGEEEQKSAWGSFDSVIFEQFSEKDSAH